MTHLRNIAILAIGLWVLLASPLGERLAAGVPIDAHAFLTRPETAPLQGQIEVGFSPGGAEPVVLRVIDSAKRRIVVAAYSFTSKSVAEALLRAKKRGVDVTVVLDSSQLTEEYSSATFLANAGIRVRIDSEHAIQHSKYVVADGETVQTGSYNYTTSAARRNAENVMAVWHNPKLAEIYERDWEYHWEHSVGYRPRN